MKPSRTPLASPLSRTLAVGIVFLVGGLLLLQEGAAFAQASADSTATPSDETELSQEQPQSTAFQQRRRNPAGLFARGQSRMGFVVGSGSGYGNNYLILGVGAGYFVMDGLALELDFDAWIGATPFIWRASPGLRYVLWQLKAIKPYGGVFYRHGFVGSGFPDTNSYGFRVGLIYQSSNRSYVGFGAVYERFFSDDGFTDRDQWYPEVMFAKAF